MGQRLALAALGTVYGEDICYSGPVMSEVELRGNRAVIHYDHVCGGLKSSDGPLRAFEVAGSDGNLAPAQAEISGETVIVSSDAVSQIKYVRYAWSGFPNSNLYNEANLPAVPFRTDSMDSL